MMAEPTPFGGMPGLAVDVVRPNLEIICPTGDRQKGRGLCRREDGQSWGRFLD
jgi:hypothetical protein